MSFISSNSNDITIELVINTDYRRLHFGDKKSISESVTYVHLFFNHQYIPFLHTYIVVLNFKS